MSLVERKKAARRLKKEFEIVRHNSLYRPDGKPVGYDPNGYTGNGRNKKQKAQGGAQ